MEDLLKETGGKKAQRGGGKKESLKCKVVLETKAFSKKSFLCTKLEIHTQPDKLHFYGD